MTAIPSANAMYYHQTFDAIYDCVSIKARRENIELEFILRLNENIKDLLNKIEKTGSTPEFYKPNIRSNYLGNAQEKLEMLIVKASYYEAMSSISGLSEEQKAILSYLKLEPNEQVFLEDYADKCIV